MMDRGAVADALGGGSCCYTSSVSSGREGGKSEGEAKTGDKVTSRLKYFRYFTLPYLKVKYFNQGKVR